MFNSLLSKVINIFGASAPTPPSPETPPTPAVLLPAGSKHRVAFVPKKKGVAKLVPAAPASAPTPSPTPPIPVQPVVDTAQANRVLENAKRLETQAQVKEAEISRRLDILDNKEQYLIQKEKTIDKQIADTRLKQESVDALYKKQLDKLEQISGLDVERAKQLIISSTEKKMTAWIAQKIIEAKESIKQREDEIAKEIVIDSIQHAVTDYVAEYTVSSITLADDKIKGKIIGKEGRNIRAFEKATGVELELDETNDIRISSFDSTRREIAKISLERMVKDGRIQPIRIEQIVAQTKADMDKILINEGKRICQEAGVFNLPIDLMKYVGRYKFRFSYGQNLALHTIEATKIAVAVAHELKADVNTVRLGALLHDIGKVVSDQEGTHVELGIDLLRQYRIPQAVIDCVAEHHQDKEFSSLASIIVYIGDAASGARPGARYEVHEEYLKRMQNIEDVAKKFPGVISVAAYQAGREVVVIVEPNQVNDNEAQILSQNIAQHLEEEAKWAGQIKVTVIREMRASSVIVGSKINKNAVKAEA